VHLVWTDFCRVTQNVSPDLRHFGISRQTLYRCQRRYDPAVEYAPRFVWLTRGRCSAYPKSSAAVHVGVARGTEGNQILPRIITGVAAKLFVVDFEVGHRTARLASPTVARQHLNAELIVRLRIEP